MLYIVFIYDSVHAYICDKCSHNTVHRQGEALLGNGWMRMRSFSG